LEEYVSLTKKKKRVCVFCGSSSGKRDCYRDAAIEFGQELVSKRLDLVYGGGGICLMGLFSKAVHSGGGHVIGYYTTSNNLCVAIASLTSAAVTPPSSSLADPVTLAGLPIYLLSNSGNK
ncbi:hypothetical protein RJ640_027959, partial [Escallonia rubra]